jgi:GTP-binding protein
VDADGKQTKANVMALLAYQGLERVEISEAGSGEIVAVAGFEEISIGDTITDPERPKALPRVEIEEPTLRMSFAVNKSPFAGKEGKYVTSRALRERLEKELETNVALRMADTDNPDTMLVSGRGELHLAILIETMRREGYEMEVSQPEVVYKEKDGKRMEPFEFLTIDTPSEHQGTVMEELGRRRGEMKEMSPAAATGDLHMEYHITTRGLLGLKSILLKKTRGTAVAHHMFEGYQPVITDLPGQQPHGSLVATEDGVSSSYAIMNIQERGELFIGPTVPVYTGMVVGQASRDQDLGVNICKQKKLTNVRSNAEATILLVPPREMTLELSLEYIGPDELLEVTPKSLRIRKRIADQKLRLRAQKEG